MSRNQWTLKVGALSDGSSFTLQINGIPFEELPKINSMQPGTGKSWDEACGMGGNLSLNEERFT